MIGRFFADWEGWEHEREWFVFERGEIPVRISEELSERDAKVHAESLNQNDLDIAREADKLLRSATLETP